MKRKKDHSVLYQVQDQFVIDCKKCGDTFKFQTGVPVDLLTAINRGWQKLHDHGYDSVEFTELVCGHFSSLIDEPATPTTPAYWTCLWCDPNGNYTACEIDWDLDWDQEDVDDLFG